MSKKAKAKYQVDKADLTVRNWQGTFICACGSIAMARRIARALNAMEAKPKAKPFAFDWSGIPKDYIYAAMDGDGEWWIYRHECRIYSEREYWYSPNSKALEINHPPYPGDWRDSLQERP